MTKAARLLRAQPKALVKAVAARLSAADPRGISFTTPDVGETALAALFAARAVAFSPAGAKVARGARSQMCHAISEALAMAEPEHYARVFGYALGSDTHWRTHSWVIDRRTGRIVEPTPLIRKAYVGVELSVAETAADAAPSG
jgi:hypothetical protein